MRRHVPVLVVALALAGCSSGEKKQPAPMPSNDAFIHEMFLEDLAKLVEKIERHRFARSVVKVGHEPIVVKNELREFLDESKYTAELVERLARCEKLALVPVAEGQKLGKGEVDFLVRGRIMEAGATKKITLDLWDPATGETPIAAMKEFRIVRDGG